MYIESLELKNFRNYEELSIVLDPGTNILYGDNAQGKTNVLEAVYLCGTTKSHRGSKDKEMIRFEQDESHIRMMVKKDGVSHKIDMHLKKNKAKGIAIDGIPIRKAAELFGIVNLVAFSPEDLNIIKNGPSERRRFMDLELCQLNKVYLQELTSYNKVLNQRNKLLKDIGFQPGLTETLDVWDMQGIHFFYFFHTFYFLDQFCGIKNIFHGLIRTDFIVNLGFAVRAWDSFHRLQGQESIAAFFTFIKSALFGAVWYVIHYFTLLFSF